MLSLPSSASICQAHQSSNHPHRQLRIIFRLCEYSQGLDSNIPNHEAYQYCLDSLPMLAASVLLNIFHPARIMPGKVSDIPSRKERKRTGMMCEVDPLQCEQGEGDFSTETVRAA